MPDQVRSIVWIQNVEFCTSLKANAGACFFVNVKLSGFVEGGGAAFPEPLLVQTLRIEAVISAGGEINTLANLDANFFRAT